MQGSRETKENSQHQKASHRKREAFSAHDTEETAKKTRF